MNSEKVILLPSYYNNTNISVKYKVLWLEELLKAIINPTEMIMI